MSGSTEGAPLGAKTLKPYTHMNSPPSSTRIATLLSALDMSPRPADFHPKIKREDIPEERSERTILNVVSSTFADTITLFCIKLHQPSARSAKSTEVVRLIRERGERRE